jgi:sterol desaturase/sphingolipid hydroxylase (fatty acid hydroxylase superfamily)
MGFVQASLDWIITRFEVHVLSAAGVHNFLLPLTVLGVTFFLEIASRKDWRFRYGSRNFRIDVLYYVFYYSGIYHVLFYAWIYGALTRALTDHAPWLQLNLVGALPPAMQVVALIFAFDFFHYWNHRLRHANRFLWAFHSIHHSQTTLTMMTTFRLHIVDETVFRILMFIPFYILGFSPLLIIWVWADLMFVWITGVQHSEWEWSYGAAGRFFVSPRFHRMHHSTNEKMQNCNFGGLFSFWDDLFGTAERAVPIPSVHGLAGNPVPETLSGQFAYPFVKIARELRRPAVKLDVTDLRP